MRAADLYWQGKDDAFWHAVNDGLPPCILMPIAAVARAAKKRGTFECVTNGERKTGTMYDLELVEKWGMPWIRLMGAVQMSEEIASVSDEAASRAASAVERLGEVVAKYRANVKNDLTSMKAQSDRVETEVQRMAQGYLNLTAILNGEPFKQAIANAERMAIALEAISKLQGARISVALFAGDEVQLEGRT